mgnify:CR=1 FL=1
MKKPPYKWEAEGDMLCLEGMGDGAQTIMWAVKCPSCYKQKDQTRYSCAWPDKEEADFILKACNNYDELRRLLVLASNHVDTPPIKLRNRRFT